MPHIVTHQSAVQGTALHLVCFLLVSQSRIAEILDGLYFEAKTQRGKGTSFERLVRQFLLTDPRYAERFDEVWMWSDWPDRGTRPDRGIDLVAREHCMRS